MKLIKKLLKLTIWILIIGFIVLFSGYHYLKSTWNDVISDEELTELVTKIKIADELPERFYELYEEAYPGALSTNLNEQILKGIFKQDFTKSPSILASTISEYTRKDGDSTHLSNRKAYVLAWKLEEETSQRECLNWALHNYKFALYIHGIAEVSQFYYHKSFLELNDREMKDVIELMKIPSLISVPEREDDKYPTE